MNKVVEGRSKAINFVFELISVCGDVIRGMVVGGRHLWRSNFVIKNGN